MIEKLAVIALKHGEPSQNPTVYSYCESTRGWQFNIELDLSAVPPW